MSRFSRRPRRLYTWAMFFVLSLGPLTSARADQRADSVAGRSKACSRCDLAGLNLRRRDLTGADLSDANLKDANLHDAKLTGARLTGTDFSGAIMGTAHLGRRDLSKARLRDADLRKTRLARTDNHHGDSVDLPLNPLVHQLAMN